MFELCSRKAAFTLIFLVSFNLSAQWQKINYPSLPTATVLGTDGNILYASTRQGIYRTEEKNGNLNWVLLQSVTQPFNSFQCVVCKGSKVFAGTGSEIYVSTDNGISWVISKSNVNNVQCMEVSENKIYAGSNDGIYLSTDDGATWNTIGPGYPNIVVPAVLKVTGTKMYAAVGGDAVSLSIDGGKNWQNLRSGFPGTQSIFVRSIAVSGTTVFAAADQGLYFTTDGNNWKLVDLGMANYDAQAVAVLGQNVFVTSSCGLFRSTNGGTNWERVYNGLPSLTAYKLITAGQTIYAVFYIGGVYRSNDNGSTWTAINTGLPIWQADLSAVEIDNSNLFILTKIGTWNDLGGLYLSSNNGSSWNYISTRVPNTQYLWTLSISNNSIFVSSIDGFYISKDLGVNWSTTEDDLTGVVFNSMKSDGQNFYAATNKGVFLSTNEGKNWTNTYTSYDNSRSVNCITMNGKNVYAGTSSGLLISSNNGKDWIRRKTITPTSNVINNIAVLDSTLYIQSGKFILISQDKGITWQTIFNSENLQNFTLADSKIYLLCNNKIYYSSDNGSKWKILFIELSSDYSINLFRILGGRLYINTSIGFWCRPLNEIPTGIENNEVELPEKFLVMQNYPNPFNPETTIRYSVPEVTRYGSSIQHMTLKVYDLLGRELETLVNEEKSAGNYEVKFNGTKIPSGVYFYRLQAGDFVQTKKMILLK